MADFVWGGGGRKISTPEQAAKQRAIAEALMASGATPAKNWAEGLADVTGAISGSLLNNEVSAAEEAGAAEVGGLFAGLGSGSSEADIIAALSNPWASDAQSSVAQALLGQQFQANDPLRQLQLQKGQLEIDAMMNPQPEVTDTMQNLWWRAEQAGLIPGTQEYANFMQTGGQAGATTNNIGSIPAGYQIDYDAQGRPVSMSPIPGSPAAQEAGMIGDKTAARDNSRDVVTDTIVSEAAKAREAAKGMGATGVGNWVSGGLGFTPAGELNTYIQSLESIASSENINAMRQASPTGGALGNTSDADLQLLKRKAGALNPQSGNFDEQLDDYERTLLRIVHGPEAGDRIFQDTRTDWEDTGIPNTRIRLKSGS